MVGLHDVGGNPLGVGVLVVVLAVLVLGRVGDVLPALQGQLVAELGAAVPALHHGLYLSRWGAEASREKKKEERERATLLF